MGGDDDDDYKPAVETLYDRLNKSDLAYGGENRSNRELIFKRTIKEFMNKDYGGQYVNFVFQERNLQEVQLELGHLGDALYYTDEALKNQMNEHYKEFITMVYEVQTLDSGMGRLRSSLADMREICMKLKDQSESDLNATVSESEAQKEKGLQNEDASGGANASRVTSRTGSSRTSAMTELYQEFEKEFDNIDVQLSQRDFRSCATIVKTVDRKIKDRKCGNTENAMLRGHLNNRKSALCKALSRELSNPTLRKSQAKFIISLMIEINQIEQAKEIYLLGRHEWLLMKTRDLEKEGDIQQMITRLAETVFCGIRSTKNEYTKHFQPKELLSSFTVWASAEVDFFWNEARKVVLSAPTFRSMAAAAAEIRNQCQQHMESERIGLMFHLESLMLKDIREKVAERCQCWMEDVALAVKDDDANNQWSHDTQTVSLYQNDEEDSETEGKWVEQQVSLTSSAFKVYEILKDGMDNMELLCEYKDLYSPIAQGLGSLISARKYGYFELIDEAFGEALGELEDEDEEDCCCCCSKDGSGVCATLPLLLAPIGSMSS